MMHEIKVSADRQYTAIILLIGSGGVGAERPIPAHDARNMKCNGYSREAGALARDALRLDFKRRGRPSTLGKVGYGLGATDALRAGDSRGGCLKPSPVQQCGGKAF